MHASIYQPPFVLVDRNVVTAHIPPAHVSLIVELPLFVAMSAVPLARIILPLVFEPRADAITLKGRTAE